MDSTKYQYEGMKWLMELELLNHPQAVNTIRFNILVASKHIKEVELLLFRENKSMLVLLELTWFGRTFLKRKIAIEVQDVLTQLLPSFKFRVTDNPVIMQLAIEKVKKALTGGQNETSNIASSDPAKLNSEQPGSSTTESGTKASSGTSENPEASDKKQSESGEAVRTDSNPDDSGKE